MIRYVQHPLICVIILHLNACCSFLNLNSTFNLSTHCLDGLPVLSKLQNPIKTVLMTTLFKKFMTYSSYFPSNAFTFACICFKFSCMLCSNCATASSADPSCCCKAAATASVAANRAAHVDASLCCADNACSL